MSRTDPAVDLQFCETILSEYFKLCPLCGLRLKEDFNLSSKSKDGLSGYCRKCQSKKFSDFREDNKERLNLYRRNRYANNREYELYLSNIRRQHPIYKQKHAERERRRTAIKNNTMVEKVNYDNIWQRDKGLCYLCNKIIIKGTEQYDHMIPLFRGGSHIYDNIKVTHRSCNAKKWAKTPEEYLGGSYV